MAEVREPDRLGVRGSRLWCEVTASYPAIMGRQAELEILTESCRIVDRLEKLDEILSGEAEEWARFRLPRSDDQPLVLMIDGALAESRQQQNVLKQLLASLRIPDEAGKRAGIRPARGSYQPKGAGTGSVSSLDRARGRAGSA